jgi:hypothetical protein
MNKKLRGGCLCGFVRYEYDGEVGPSSYCHCDDCKRATGGPYTVGMLSEVGKLRILNGKVKGYTTIADSGSKVTREFCPKCGSPLFTRAEKCPDRVFIKAGSLDEPEVVSPSFQTWTERAVSWAYLDKSLIGYHKGELPKNGDSK